jgi:catechol 2,3-dioxygenase-like lactoylglutathione lyase family enzyme
MKIKRVVPDIKSDRIEETRDFYAGFLGFQIGMDMGWVITFVSRSNPTAQVTVMREDESAALQPQMSIEVDDVDRAHAMAIERNLRIVYPLSDEPWGVRRFFVADPNGVVINILSHTTAQKRSSERSQPRKARRKTTGKRGSRKRLPG